MDSYSNFANALFLPQKFEENAVETKGSEFLPVNWNEKEYFILRYVEPIKKSLLLIKIIPSESILLVNALLKAKDQDLINATSFDPKKLITDDYKEFAKLFVDGDESLKSLVNELKKDILDKFEPPKKPVESQVATNERPARSAPRPEPRPAPINPINPSLMIHDPRPHYPTFPQIGGADLDPLGRGIGGGMLMDPRGLPQQFIPPGAGGQPSNPFMPPGPRFDPSSGLDQRLPPGAVPPGARFSYFGPPRPRAPNQPSQQQHPDMEHMPDYDDMYM